MYVQPLRREIEKYLLKDQMIATYFVPFMIKNQKNAAILRTIAEAIFPVFMHYK